MEEFTCLPTLIGPIWLWFWLCLEKQSDVCKEEAVIYFTHKKTSLREKTETCFLMPRKSRQEFKLTGCARASCTVTCASEGWL